MAKAVFFASLVLSCLTFNTAAHAGANERYTYCWLEDFSKSPKITYYSAIFKYPENETLSIVRSAFEAHIEDNYGGVSSVTSCEFALTGATFEDVARKLTSRISVEKTLRNKVIETVWQY